MQAGDWSLSAPWCGGVVLVFEEQQSPAGVRHLVGNADFKNFLQSSESESAGVVLGHLHF